MTTDGDLFQGVVTIRVADARGNSNGAVLECSAGRSGGRPACMVGTGRRCEKTSDALRSGRCSSRNRKCKVELVVAGGESKQKDQVEWEGQKRREI